VYNKPTVFCVCLSSLLFTDICATRLAVQFPNLLHVVGLVNAYWEEKWMNE